jgi:hypothetical protein
MGLHRLDQWPLSLPVSSDAWAQASDSGSGAARRIGPTGLAPLAAGSATGLGLFSATFQSESASPRFSLSPSLRSASDSDATSSVIPSAHDHGADTGLPSGGTPGRTRGRPYPGPPAKPFAGRGTRGERAASSACRKGMAGGRLRSSWHPVAGTCGVLLRARAHGAAALPVGCRLALYAWRAGLGILSQREGQPRMARRLTKRCGRVPCRASAFARGRGARQPHIPPRAGAPRRRGAAAAVAATAPVAEAIGCGSSRSAAEEAVAVTTVDHWVAFAPVGMK